jgi:hypothetical protein
MSQGKDEKGETNYEVIPSSPDGCCALDQGGGMRG